MSLPYIGRFAPSPTGLLHLGSLYTAVASFLDAKACNGRWLVRIEDLDPPREQPGASQIIIQQLLDHGLQSDDAIIYQSLQHARYQQTCDQLVETQQAFYCTCSRKDLQQLHGFYHGLCRGCFSKPQQAAAIRLKVANAITSFNDRCQQLQQNPLPEALVDDFIIKRKDDLYAYQLAVVLDDIEQNISHIVRGVDILPSTFRQLALYQTLQKNPPSYLHLPIITFDQQKLSKQNHAPVLNSQNACDNLCYVLQLLGQKKPNNMRTPQHILEHAIHHWQPELIANTAAIAATAL